MTFREKLADWISGGKMSEMKSEVALAAFNLAEQRLICSDRLGRALAAENALREIISQQTPGANATVTRMARIAREALGE